MASISCWLPSISFDTLSNTLPHRIPARPFVTYTHTVLLAIAGNLFFGMLLKYILPFQNFSHSYLFLSGCIPSPALNTLLLVVLEHPSTFSAAVIRTVSTCLTDFAFSSHASPAHSSFGTITFIRKYILILVPRCESVTIASILPTGALPFSTAPAMGVQYPKSSPLRFLHGGTYFGLQSVLNLLGCLRRSLVGLGFLQSVSYIKPIPTHEKIFAVGKKWPKCHF